MPSRLLYKTILSALMYSQVTLGFRSARISRKFSTHLYNLRQDELMSAGTLQLAPMMEYTDRHFRHLVRLLSKRTLLYTEMVAANAIAHERSNHMSEYRDSHLGASEEDVLSNYNCDYIASRFLAQGTAFEGASVLQLGGSDPTALYEAARATTEIEKRSDYFCNYTALNLNCGCPSPKVAGKGCFGAALMDDPVLVRDLCQAMHEGTDGNYPVSVKCRIGTDTKRPFSRSPNDREENDDEQMYEELCQFIETIASGGIVTDFTVHARIAVLTKSFSPSDNRKIPPLKYDIVQRLVRDYPGYKFTLNGGIESIEDVQREMEACPNLHGAMIGRAFCADPWRFSMADELLYKDEISVPHRWHVLEQFAQYADKQEASEDPTRIRRFIVKAVTGLFSGEPNAKRYRIALDESVKLLKQGDKTPISELILRAAQTHLSEETLYRSPQESYARLSGRHSEELVKEWQAARKAAV